MTFRLTEKTALQGVVQQMLKMHHYLMESDLDHSLMELMSMRASQINGCAHYLAMHTKVLREAGEREDRLAVLPAWRESGWFSPREQAALAWTEAVTTLDDRDVPDSVFAEVRTQFSEQELVDLTWATIAVNAANRLSIAFRYPPTPFTIDAGEVAAAD